MLLDSRVKVYGKDVFRPKLSIVDVKRGNGVLVDVFSSNDELSKDGVNFSEKALTFVDEPIVIPNSSYLYYTRLRTVDDVILERLVSDLMFYNPNIGEVGISKMVSWIVSYFVGCDKENRKLITHEQLLPRVSELCDKYHGGDIDIIQNNRVILYSLESMLTKHDKQWYSNYYRSKRISNIRAELIHEGALIASKNLHKYLKITKPRVVDFTKDTNSVMVMNRYISEKTVQFLEDENNRRYFKSDETIRKYIIFTESYDKNKPLDFYTEQLNISKSTAVEFKKLLNK